MMTWSDLIVDLNKDIRLENQWQIPCLKWIIFIHVTSLITQYHVSMTNNNHDYDYHETQIYINLFTS